MAERIGPVCSPAIAGALSGGARTADVPALPDGATPLHTWARSDAWPRWAELSGTVPPTGRGQWFEHFYFSLKAASAGLGVAMGSWAMVRQGVAAGTLVTPFGFLEDGSG